ncbi:MAG: hypothetical protein ACJAVW_003514, partial [Spirosomataceae bacterium]
DFKIVLYHNLCLLAYHTYYMKSRAITVSN